MKAEGAPSGAQEAEAGTSEDGVSEAGEPEEKLKEEESPHASSHEPQASPPKADTPPKPGLRLKGQDDQALSEPSVSETPASETPDPALSSLPFSLPERIGDEPPPLPTFNSVVGTSGTPPRKVEKPKPDVTFDDLEPAHSDKAPPPLDAPVHQGKVRKHQSQIGKIMVFVIPAALVILGAIYMVALLQQEPAAPVETTAPAATPNTATTASEDASSDERWDEEAGLIGAPVDPDPAIAVIVDELEVNLARPNASPQIVILNGVRFTPGEMVNAEAGLRFVGFHEDPAIREIVFEDSRGARYFRGY